MKIAVAILTLVLLAGCGPFSQPITHIPIPSSTPTQLPTATPTVTPSPTPDPKTQTYEELRSKGIDVDVSTGRLSRNGIDLIGASFDKETGDLHVQVGEQDMVVPQAQVLKRLSVKGDSVVIYDKDQALYDEPDQNNWPKVQAAFNPNVRGGRWAGWISREAAISTDPEAPIIVGNTYDAWGQFVNVEKAFFQPYTSEAKWPRIVNPKYSNLPDFPFAPFDVQRDSGGDNPFRYGVNYSIVQANNLPGQDHIIKDVGIITEQVLNPNDRFYAQAFHFASGNDSKVPINRKYQTNAHPSAIYFYYSAYLLGRDGCLLPEYVMGYGGWHSVSRWVPLTDYYMVYGFMDSSKRDTGRMTALVLDFMATGIINDVLKQAWLADAEPFLYR